MSTLNNLEKVYINDLKSIYPEKEIKSIFKLLILELFKINSISFLLKKYNTVSSSKEKKIIEYLNRLQKYEPVQYILGYTNFLDLKFKLNNHVLIPRKETEELVIWCKSFLNKRNKILDIGTGSGCIAISLAKDQMVTAIDVCNDALKIAKYNAKLNGVNIKFIKDDILQFNEKSILIEKQDIIISNPPYVLIDQIKKMHKNVYMHEPRSAIFVNSEDPLIFYKKIIQFSKRNLNKNGLLFFEINEFFGEKIVSLLKKNKFQEIELKKDIYKKNRMVKALFN